MFGEEEKKREIPTSPEITQEEEDNYTDAFSKWVRDKLRGGNKKMVEVD